MLLVGLTGNYGMGKSTILSMFKKFGAITLDADSIVKILLTEKDILKKIRGLLGDKVFYKNGSLNKEKVAKLIFKNKNLRHNLEDILHPIVFERINDFLDKIHEQDRVIVIEIPLLYERGYEDRFDRTITVHTKEDIALDRIEKEGIDRKDALLRLKSQLPVKEKVKRSDFIIDNNGTIEDTMAQVEMIYRKLSEEVYDGDDQRSRGIKRELS
jgi:dephospho-CoA kinase